MLGEQRRYFMKKIQNNPTCENTPFDDVFRTLLEKCTKLIIPVINEVFHTSYDWNEPVQLLANEHFVYTDGKYQKRITDSHLLIQNNGYHIECESRSGTGIVIRMMEYDFHIALQNIEKTDGQYTMEFPHSAVIFIRKADDIPENMTVNVRFADGQTVKYGVPAVKINTYTKEEIFDKNLLFFLPYYIMRFEKDMKEINHDDTKRKALVEDYEDIYRRLCTMQETQQIDEDYLYNLVELMNRLIGVVAKDADNVKGEVINMGGRVLELQSDIFKKQYEELLQEINQSRQEGMKEVIAMMVVNMSQNNMTTQQIASIARISVDEVEKILRREQ
jgi:hypothetical protein